MPYPWTSAAQSSRQICQPNRGVEKNAQRSRHPPPRNPKRSQLYRNWKRNGATPAPRRTCWRSGFPVNRQVHNGWYQALTDIWFQDVIAVGKYHSVIDASHHLLRLDVGGGAVKNETRNALARIPLRWMIRQCFLADTGIMFNSQLLPQIGLDPGTLYPRVLSRPDPVTFERTDRSRIASDHSTGTVTIVNKEMILTEEEEDLADILSPINDQLVLAKSWWLLEILPLKYRHQNEDGTWCWRTRYGCLHHIMESFLTSSFTPFFLGLIWLVVGTSPAATPTRSERTERSSFEWTLRKCYFPRAVDTCLKLSPGNTTAWSGLIKRFMKSVPSLVAAIPLY